MELVLQVPERLAAVAPDSTVLMESDVVSNVQYELLVYANSGVAKHSAFNWSTQCFHICPFTAHIVNHSGWSVSMIVPEIYDCFFFWPLTSALPQNGCAVHEYPAAFSGELVWFAHSQIWNVSLGVSMSLCFNQGTI